ncbi:MAG: SdpI family protein [Patescibacteria group bacterium]|jgi:uncharacterized membrane protein
MRLSFKKEIPILILLLISVLSSFWFYAHMPAVVPIHWGINGQADGFGSREFAAYFFPALIVGLYLLLTFIPYLDPKKERYIDFLSTYWKFRFGFILFFLFIYFIASSAGVGYNIPIGQVMAVAMGVLFIFIGNYLAKIKPNWFVGIRTPWTLSSEEVWNKTHRLGGKLFALSGIISIFSIFFASEIMFIVVIGSVIFCAIFSILYSYIVFRAEKKKTQLTQ